MLVFSALFSCAITILLAIAYNMQGMTLFTQILATINVSIWIAIAIAILRELPWSTTTRRFCCNVGNLLSTASAFKFAMQRRAYRQWGIIFYIVAALMLTAETVSDNGSLYMIAVPPAIAITLAIIGWIINHWPDAEYFQRDFQ